ncbi:hypothetical protein LJC35_04915 [Parabacteroides sp. OttesenSCG-928-N08]|nr:hypothetical protein [Parabacteroides sp. OttesenSCG-928-N08]
MQIKRYIPTAILAVALLTACQQSDEPGISHGGEPLTTIISAPPAWEELGATTRSVIDNEGRVSWEENDQLYGTLTFVHNSGLKDAKEITINLLDGTFAGEAPTWPVGEDVIYAELDATFGYDINGDRLGYTIPIYHTTATALPGQPLKITFGADAHRTAQITFKEIPTDTPITIGDINDTTTADGDVVLYPLLPADATEVSCTIDDIPYSIKVGEGGPLGKMHSVNIKTVPGGTDPGEIRKILTETERFIAWATAYNASPTTAEANFTQQYHIDLSAIDSWTPITNYTGIFDGAGYTIRGLKMNSTNVEQGLFRYTNTSATIAGVTLIEPQVKGTGNYNYNGALVGRNSGHITNCHIVGGSVQGEDQVGGLVGRNIGTIVACSSSSCITSKLTVGGLVGYNNGGIIAFCYATGTVTGTKNRAGGLAGENLGTISSSFSTGNVIGSSDVGSLLGENRTNSTVQYCNANGTVKINDNEAVAASADNLIGTTSGTATATDNTFHTATADIFATLKGYTGSVTVRIPDGNGSTKEVTIDSTIWQDDLTLDWEAGQVENDENKTQ